MSPRHAHLEERGAVWWCVDDDSTNGVFIDDERTADGAPLASGTRIGIGSTILKFLSGKDLERQYHEEIYRLTVCDGLTQVYLKRYLVEALDAEIRRGRRRSSALAVLMIEIDELGAIDDPNGMSRTGDRVLREVAHLLQRFVPREGILARYGHERFVMLLPERTLEAVRAVAEGLCETIANSPLAMGPHGLRATVCAGGAQRRDDDRASADILERASRALHVAKSRGRNQVECDEVSGGPPAR